MERRQKPYAISRPQLLEVPPPLVQQAAPLPTITNSIRPLSDIRELSEPTVVIPPANRVAKQAQSLSNIPHARSAERRILRKTSGPIPRSRSIRDQTHGRSKSFENASSSYSTTPERSSFYSIPHSSVPQRSSSQTHARQPAKGHCRRPSVRGHAVPRKGALDGFIVTNHGQSRSPVKEVGLRLDPVRSDTGRRVPSRTCMRTPHPVDILEYPTYRHPRIKLELHVSAPLFVGGGSIEGYVKMTIDANERLKSRRSLGIGAMAVDLLGFEDMVNGRKSSFLAVGSELLDADHPPSADMVEPPNPLTPNADFWTLTPSTSVLPFMISLPLDTGPPPFLSRNANIRFLLCATALISDVGKHYRVRTSQDVCVIATYDPEKALTSLPSPLTATDEITLPRFGRCDTLRVTAGLHRQVWVSGGSVFVDVHIINKTHKPVKRLDLTLERDILCYKHAPAKTREKSASHARIFESNEQCIITRSSFKTGQQCWNGIPPNESETRTYELELPRGHATVRCGKCFEVRFFLNVAVSLSSTTLVSVQLPIILIHMNSLDVLPNSVAQVAAAIEEKRARGLHQRKKSRSHKASHRRQNSISSPAAMAELRRHPSYSQGRAFAAPRQQSINRQRAIRADVEDLRQTLDSSPRKFESRLHGTAIKKIGSSMSIGNISLRARNNIADGLVREATYRTPSKTCATQSVDHSAIKPVSTSRNPLRRMQSAGLLYGSNKGLPVSRPTEACLTQNIKPQFNFSVVKDHIQPHTLGLSSSGRQPGLEQSRSTVTRPGTELSVRDETSRRRFEFKAVRQTESGSLMEKGMNWWEQVKHKDRDKEGWI